MHEPIVVMEKKKIARTQTRTGGVGFPILFIRTVISKQYETHVLPLHHAGC